MLLELFVNKNIVMEDCLIANLFHRCFIPFLSVPSYAYA